MAAVTCARKVGALALLALAALATIGAQRRPARAPTPRAAAPAPPQPAGRSPAPGPRTALLAAADTMWRGTFLMIERTLIDADTSVRWDGQRRRAAVGQQVNVGVHHILQQERVIRLDGELLPRWNADGRQVARIAATYTSSMKSVESMPAKLRCTTEARERVTTIVRTTEQRAEGASEVEDEVTATSLGIDVVGPSLLAKGSLRVQVVGDDACGVDGAPDVVHTSTDEVTMERYAIAVAPDPRNPNVSAGSRIERPLQNVVRTWVWSLRRGPGTGELAIEKVTLDQHVFPDADAWVPVGAAGTVDGNTIRLRVTVANDGDESVAGMLTIRDAATGRMVGPGRFAVTVGAKTSRAIEYMWDTQGWAWEPGLTGASARKLEVRISDGAPGREFVEVPLLVRPKPVILVHGLWSDASTWTAYQGYLNEAHSFAWLGRAVGDGAAGTVGIRMRTGVLGAGTLLDETNSIWQNANAMAKYVRAVRQESNAWHVDAVGHSMGGLITRLYLTLAPPTPEGTPVVRHLVMLGTPNLGSPCSVPLDFLGDARVEAYRQLTPEVAEAFNERVRDLPAVRYAILAGDPLPRFACADGPFDFTQNDGVVSVPSAFAWYADRGRSRSLHTDMTGSEGDFRAFVLLRLAEPPAGP